jgi:penicillin amidase
MRPSSLKFTLLILAVAVVASGQVLEPMTARVAPVNARAAVDDDPVTTTRDAQGIWFIEGGSLYDVFEAMGYAVAQDRLWQMDLLRRQGRGTLSALLGADLVGTDVFLRTIGYSDEELTALFEELSPDGKTAFQGYTDGINRRIGEFYAGDWMQMPYEYWLLGLQSVFSGPGLPVLPAPFTVNDTTAWFALLQRNFDPEALNMGQLDNATLVQTLAATYGAEAFAMFTDLRWINDPAAQTMIPSAVKSVPAQTFDFATAEKMASLPNFGAVADRMRSRVDTYFQQMEALNARVKMGSYAWTVSGDKTASGNATMYSGPQMGFDTPSIVTEGSIRGGGLNVSGMTVPGIPAIIIGRTPHHSWSMQVGHAHTVDYYLEAPQSVMFNRFETIKVFGGDDVVIPIFRSSHGPIVEPMPYNPADPPQIIVAWAYAHWGREAKSVESFFNFARSESMAGFDEGIETVAVSQHFTYADRDGNIAYWMSGWDPIRAPGVDPRFPSIADGTTEWTGERRPRVHDENTPQGYYGGWNNKAAADYNNAPNSYSYYLGLFHRAHVIEEYLSTHDDLTYEEVRDLALNIATTDSFGSGGNTWAFVADDFTEAVADNPSAERDAAIEMLDAWDGHFVAGGPGEWRFGTLRADAWVLQDAWIREVLRLTFEDEFATAGLDYNSQRKTINFNVLLRALAGPAASIPTVYDWFQDKSGSGKPTTAEAIIVLALDNVLETIGPGDYNFPRGYIHYIHQVYGEMWQTPYSSRSTYAHCVEFDMNGPIRIESMFPLGESGETLPDQYGKLWINPNFFSMIPNFDPFLPRPFPLFE